MWKLPSFREERVHNFEYGQLYSQFLTTLNLFTYSNHKTNGVSSYANSTKSIEGRAQIFYRGASKNDKTAQRKIVISTFTMILMRGDFYLCNTLWIRIPFIFHIFSRQQMLLNEKVKNNSKELELRYSNQIIENSKNKEQGRLTLKQPS